MRIVQYVPVSAEEVEHDGALRDRRVTEQSALKDFSRRAKRARAAAAVAVPVGSAARYFHSDVARSLQSWPWHLPGHSVCILHGPTGVGKSTVCRRALQCFSGTVVRFEDLSDEMAVTVSLVQLESAVSARPTHAASALLVVFDPVHEHTSVPAQVLHATHASVRIVVVWDNDDEAGARKWVTKTWPRITRIDRTLAVPAVPRNVIAEWLIASQPALSQKSALQAAHVAMGSPRQAQLALDWLSRGSRGCCSSSDAPRCDVVFRDPVAFLRERHAPEEFALVDFDPSEIFGACHKLQCTSPDTLSHLSVLHTRASPAIVSELLLRHCRLERNSATAH